MDCHRELLSRPHLTVISGEPDLELARLAALVRPSVRLDGRAELELLFGRLLMASDAGAPIAPKTLDFVGHATAATSQLRLGDWVLDAANSTVKAFFRELAEHDALARLGIHAVRLLACKTAETGQGRSTICALADILGVEVHGTSHLLYDAHYGEDGFRDEWEFLLVCASDLRRTTSEPCVVPAAAHWPRTLDVDALPAAPLGPRATPWPRRIAPAAAARQLLALIQRDAGAQLPGLLATPSCELALPSAVPGAYHVAQVLLDGSFLRFFPDGAAAPGVLYPVDDAHLLRRIVDELPGADVSR